MQITNCPLISCLFATIFFSFVQRLFDLFQNEDETSISSLNTQLYDHAVDCLKEDKIST